MIERMRRRPKAAAGIGVVAVAVLAWIAFGWFGFHTILFDETVDEAVPVFESGAGPSGLPSDAQSPELVDEMNETMRDAGTPMEAAVDDPMPGTDGSGSSGSAQAEIVTIAQGSFVPRSHPAEGTALVLNDGSEQRFLRFEDFATDNGPDLNVYLSAAAPDAPAGEFDDDFVDLGDLKGNVGPQNYEIPLDVDLSHHSTVVIWCVRFGVAFGAAPLA